MVMKFCCPLITVKNMDTSKKFYQEILGQTIKFDFGENITFEGDFAIQLATHYADMIGIEARSILEKSNNFELYFEEEDFDELIIRLENYPNIQYIQRCIEHSWGQRVVRFYDPDMHIIEVGESMEAVVTRLLRKGMTVEEVMVKSQYLYEFVMGCKAKLND